MELVDEAGRRAASFVSARSRYECGQTWRGAAAGLALESFLTSACQTNSKKIKSCVNKDRWKGIYISAYYPSRAIFLRRLPSAQHQVSHCIKTFCPIHTRSGRSSTHNSPYYNDFIVFMLLLMVYLLFGYSSATVSSSVDLITPQGNSRHIFRLPTMNFFGRVPSRPAGHKSFNISRPAMGHVIQWPHKSSLNLTSSVFPSVSSGKKNMNREPNKPDSRETDQAVNL